MYAVFPVEEREVQGILHVMLEMIVFGLGIAVLLYSFEASYASEWTGQLL
ncbi:hypothetical protein [Bacillus pacificus]|nr:hypothetical protein [Bacillus cereus group sp. Bc010]MDA2767479.1 hypothetical protein [Bacillus cereus group sp. Bc010]MED1445470.1 hypothetical protein [Bacillus pacificus]